MKTGRLEAFSDGVLAIIITVMVLGLPIPNKGSFNDLLAILPKIISYILSFVYVAIYWNNHHHLFQAIEKVNGKVLWANMALLFMLSLIPFSTAWMGDNHFTRDTVILYGMNLFFCASTYAILVKVASCYNNENSIIRQSIRNIKKTGQLDCI